MLEWAWQAGLGISIFLIGYITSFMGVMGIFIGLNWRSDSIVNELLTEHEDLWNGVAVVIFGTPVIPALLFTVIYWL